MIQNIRNEKLFTGENVAFGSAIGLGSVGLLLSAHKSYNIAVITKAASSLAKFFPLYQKVALALVIIGVVGKVISMLKGWSTSRDIKPAGAPAGTDAANGSAGGGASVTNPPSKTDDVKKDAPAPEAGAPTTSATATAAAGAVAGGDSTAAGVETPKPVDAPAAAAASADAPKSKAAPHKVDSEAPYSGKKPDAKAESAEERAARLKAELAVAAAGQGAAAKK